ncbi:hypothetical protein [Antrihabitans spumae]|jgi:hypothetical protein|uniref:Uncharacterized protein n=1 Tax=Antrihabitans spumae TaxID=3373370 RepID=A0ABW7K0I0_9NOCA
MIARSKFSEADERLISNDVELAELRRRIELGNADTRMMTRLLLRILRPPNRD